MKTGSLSVHSENILPIIKKWLYSERDIFLRELISNATDAIYKLKILQAKSLTKASTIDFRIDVTIDAKNKTLSVEDNGIGMNFTEVEKYITQIAFSGAQDFVEKYQEKDQIIGHFGLGFFSTYMVAEKVEILTLSHEDNAQAVFWSCDGSTNYQIDVSQKPCIGTKVTLFLDKDNLDLLDEQKVRKILFHYCPYLPFSIFLNGVHINNKDPLYLKSASSCTDKEYLDFYHELYPLEPDPLFWVHLQVDFPFHLKGILYFPKIHNQFDINKSKIKLFCNRVFVSDNCKDILADYLMILRGAIDSPDIPLNVSRSHLQADATVKQLGQHVSKKVTDRLQALYTSDREKFISYWKDVEIIVKLGILQDEKFYDRAKNFLIWKTSDDTWATLEEIKNQSLQKNKIFYTQEESSHFLSLYKEKKIPVLFFHPYIDNSLLGILEDKLDVKFQRIDSAVEDELLDNTKEKNLLDVEGRSESSKMADFFADQLSSSKPIKVEAKSLASSSVVGFFLLKEEERRFKNYLKMNAQAENLPFEETFVINTNNKLVEKAYQLRMSKPSFAKELVEHIYLLTKVSQKDVSGIDLEKVITSSQKLIEQLL